MNMNMSGGSFEDPERVDGSAETESADPKDLKKKLIDQIKKNGGPDNEEIIQAINDWEAQMEEKADKRSSEAGALMRQNMQDNFKEIISAAENKIGDTGLKLFIGYFIILVGANILPHDDQLMIQAISSVIAGAGMASMVITAKIGEAKEKIFNSQQEKQ